MCYIFKHKCSLKTTIPITNAITTKTSTLNTFTSTITTTTIITAQQ